MIGLDAPTMAACSECGRQTIVPERLGKRCGMTQPGGLPCFGVFRARAVSVSDPAETLALIEQHRLVLEPLADDRGWQATHHATMRYGDGSTIGDAVRACVARIEGKDA